MGAKPPHPDAAADAVAGALSGDSGGSRDAGGPLWGPSPHTPTLRLTPSPVRSQEIQEVHEMQEGRRGGQAPTPRLRG